MIIIIISATDPLNACLNSFNISVSGLDSFNGKYTIYVLLVTIVQSVSPYKGPISFNFFVLKKKINFIKGFLSLQFFKTCTTCLNIFFFLKAYCVFNLMT